MPPGYGVMRVNQRRAPKLLKEDVRGGGGEATPGMRPARKERKKGPCPLDHLRCAFDCLDSVWR